MNISYLGMLMCHLLLHTSATSTTSTAKPIWTYRPHLHRAVRHRVSMTPNPTPNPIRRALRFISCSSPRRTSCRWAQSWAHRQEVLRGEEQLINRRALLIGLGVGFGVIATLCLTGLCWWGR